MRVHLQWKISEGKVGFDMIIIITISAVAILVFYWKNNMFSTLFKQNTVFPGGRVCNMQQMSV